MSEVNKKDVLYTVILKTNILLLPMYLLGVDRVSRCNNERKMMKTMFSFRAKFRLGGGLNLFSRV